MSFPRYPSYKNSGVEWLGQVPEHWDVTQLKRVVNPERQITYGIVQAGPHVPDGVPYIRPADMTDEQGVAAPEEVMRTSLEIVSAYSRSTLHTGDLVCSIGPSFGKVMITPEWLDGANLTQGTARIAVQPPHDARYLFWTLRSPLSVAQWESSVGGATFRALNLGPLAETTIPVPSETEQTHIAEFLDRETRNIDALVAEQRLLMELLKEKRQAVISHAVTRGLNPSVALKPSGIEWLGDVPAHWTVATVRRIVDRIEQGWSPECIARPAETDEWGVVKSGCVNRGVFDDLENKALPDSLEPIPAYEIHVGDVLTSRASGSPELVGSTAYISATRPKLMLSDKIFRIHLEPSVDREFYVALFNSRIMRSQIERAISGADGLANNLPQSAMKGFFCMVPPLDEQKAIVAFLDSELTKLNTLTAEAQRAIDLLQERRTALISAAVTGQIDVRTFTEKEAA